MAKTKPLDAVLAEVARHPGATARVSVSRNNHIRVVLEAPGGTRTLFTSNTPSDHRAALNAVSDARRLLRDIAGEK